MHLRQIFEDRKTAVFALGRLNPATIGHERLVNKIKEQKGDPFLFLTDRPSKLPDDPLAPQEKLEWAQKSFDGIQIRLAKTIATAANQLYRLGYNEITFLEGEDKLFNILKNYNGKFDGKKGPIEFPFKFDKLNYVRLQRNADDPGASGMSATKLRQFAQDNDLEKFTSGLAQKAQPSAEKMMRQLQGALGVDPVEEDLQELEVKQQKPKLDVLNNIAARTDGRPFPLSWNAGKDEISVGGKMFVSPKTANKFIRFFDNQEKENQELMKKALSSAKTAAQLFKNLGFEFKLDMER